MSQINPGPTGNSLPSAVLVFRIARDSQLSPAAKAARKALPGMFELSTKDKEQGGRLSVWVEELTIADQAWAFLGKKPANTVVACLAVNDIRSVVPIAPFAPMDVVWDEARDQDAAGNWIMNRSPGASGHCGITGLNQGGDNKTDKERRKEFRSKLADIARISPVPVPHNFDEAVIRVVAYFLWEQDNKVHGYHFVHWISAVRKLRRIEVKKVYSETTFG